MAEVEVSCEAVVKQEPDDYPINWNVEQRPGEFTSEK